MNYDNYDNKLRAKFESYTPSVDESAMWANIEKELPSPSRDNNYLFVLIGLVVLGSVCVLAYSKLDTNSNTSTSATLNKEHIQLEVASIEVQKGDAIISDVETQDNNRVLATGANTVDSDQTLAHTVGQNEKSVVINNAEPYKYTGSEKTIVLSSQVQKDHTPVDSPISGIDESVLLATNNLVEQITNLSILPKRNFGLSFSDRILELNFGFHKEHFDLRISKWAFDWGVSAGKTTSLYKVNGTGGNEIVNLRERLETDLESLSSQIGVQYNLLHNWSVGLGLMYLTQVNSSEVAEVTERQFSMLDRQFLETQKITHLRYQRTQQLLLPISLKYNKEVTEKWGYQLGVGYAYNLWSDYRGILQDQAEQVYDLSTDVDGRLDQKGSDRLILETNITRRLADFGQLKVGVNYLQDLKGRYRSDYFIQRKSHAIQLSGGLIIPLNF